MESKAKYKNEDNSRILWVMNEKVLKHLTETLLLLPSVFMDKESVKEMVMDINDGVL